MRAYLRLALYIAFICSIVIGEYVLSLNMVQRLLSIPLIILVLLLLRFQLIEDLYNYLKNLEFKKISNKFRLKLGEYTTKKHAFLFILALIIFIFHFWLQVISQKEIIYSGMLHIVVHPFNFILQEGFIEALSYRYFQVNSYSGNPFFLLPFVYMAGYSPDAFRMILLGVVALVFVIYFLVYYEALDLEKAILGILILGTLKPWIFQWWPDYDYTDLFAGIMLLLYFRWKSLGASASSNYIYLMCFLGGIFFYFKATLLYVIIGIGTATLYLKRENLIDFLKEVNVPKMLVFFIIGLMPFLAFNLGHSDTLFSDEFSYRGESEYDLNVASVERFNQVDHWLRSDVVKMPAMMGFVDRPIQVADHLGLHFLTLLFLGAMILLLVTRQHTDLAIIFIIFYILMLFLPGNTSLAVQQMLVFVPIVVLVILAGLDSIHNKIGSIPVYRILLVIFVLAFGITHIFYLDITSSNQIDTNDDKSSEVPLDTWGGDQEFYNNVKALNVSQPVLTNSYRVLLTTDYLLDIRSSEYLASSNSSKKNIKHDISSSGIRANVIDFYKNRVVINGFRKDPHVDYSESSFTLILKTNISCGSEREVCAQSTEEVLENFNLTRQEMEDYQVSGDSYFLARNVTLNED